MYYYDEIPLHKMELARGKLLYPCPCGDTFELSIDDLLAGSEKAECPTCSLAIRVLYTAEERDQFLSQHAFTLDSGRILVA